MKADEILSRGAETLAERGRHYDKGSERSMYKTVVAFNALTGHNLSEVDGWHFMELLKFARSYGGEYKFDNYLDKTNYAALAAECADETWGELEAEPDFPQPATPIEDPRTLSPGTLIFVRDYDTDTWHGPHPFVGASSNPRLPFQVRIWDTTLSYTYAALPGAPA